MGRNASSSKRKASKRKSSKLSSEDRKRKKSRKNKSRKLRRHDDSSYSDDDSMSSFSVSSTSSEDDYKSRKVQSRSRSDARNVKKKSRKRSPSPTRSKDPSRTKKRKRLNKDVDSKSKKKPRKVKRKRKISISSTSSDSSTGSSEESELERCRGRSRERRISKRDPLKTKAGNKKSRSPSYFSSSRYSHHSRSVSPCVEQIALHNESRRLKSVISVVEHRHEMDEKDPYEEEIVDDRNDYPSSRSNDSNDGVSRRKSTYLSRVASEEEITLSNLREKDLIEAEVDCSGQHKGADSNRLETTIPEKENEAEIPITAAGSGNDDLELILRQKALENLRRFRGERQMESKTTNSPNNDRLSAAMAEDVHKNSLKFDASNEQCAATDIEKSDNPILERNLTNQAEIGTNNAGGGKTENDPGFSKQNDIPKPLSGISKNEKNSTAYAVNEKYESGFSAPGQEDLSASSEVKQATTSSVPFDSNLMATKSIAIGKAPSISPLSPGVGVDNICRSTSKEPKNPCGESTSAEHSSKEHQDESKDGSQFEKKTMSVMRGGEMVQVSYKVYIPKKVPALARRQLKR